MPRQDAIPIEVFPSPITANELDGNIYHAHALRPEGLAGIYYALHLKWLFEKFGHVRPASHNPKTFLRRMRDWINRKLEIGLG
jgi:hypothetical protein